MNRVLTRTEKALRDSRARTIQRAFRSTHANRVRRGTSARVIQRAFRSLQERSRAGAISKDITKMAFCTSPYDRVLNLTDKEDRKLFNDACRGLEKEDRFDGTLSKSSQFLKLIGKELEDFRLDEIFIVAVKWDSSTAAPRVLSKTTNALEAGNVADDAIKKHCDLVWAQTEHRVDTPEYYAAFDTMPTSTSELQALQIAQP